MIVKGDSVCVCIRWVTDLASSSWSSSTRDFPTEIPLAFRKVKTIPPPSTSLSTLFNMASITEILEDTFDPPTIAANGLLGVLTAPSK